MLVLLAIACATDSAPVYTEYDPDLPLVADEDATHPFPMLSDEATAQGLTSPPIWVNPAGGPVVALTPPVQGRWVYPGAEVGYASADAACRAVGADHLCTEDELRGADLAGSTLGAPPDVSVWMRARHHGADCRGGTYQGADANWTGVNGRYERTGVRTDGQTVSRLKIDVAAASESSEACLRDLSACDAVTPHGFECNTPRSVACCK